ncbi:MAG: ABC transporter permease [Candidatus Edwardsbacteria bacterium]|nr:ABC transporter permease [Candidatus Edwardsbacteria bacterium]MBU1577104.1 ABC transporter permease [Candidatus Edwardsbacteria bacterium]MBU2463559.1 ABC transporter permease [Candidatus Edwardsbacteria bacterium]MBU2594036.1 ABC transporter permease [Candidatus Edwardsbacteria bacterium]
MNIWESVRLAFDAIWAHKLRSGLTTLGILIGVLTVIGMLALIDGFNKMIAKQLSSLGTTTLYVQKQGLVMSHDDWLKTRGRKNLTIEDAYAIRDNCPSVLRVAPMLDIMANIKFGKQEVIGTEVNGTTPEFQFIADYEIIDGRAMSNVDMVHSRPVAMLGYTVVEKLFGQQDPLGKEISINGNRFEVIALLGKKGSFLGNDQDNMLLIPISTYQKMFSGQIRNRGRGGSVTIAVQPLDVAHIESAKDEVTELLRRRRKVPPSKPDDFGIVTADQIMGIFKKITAGVFGLMIGVTLLSLLVGGIGIMNIMLVSVNERIKEIGIRKAIGARKKDIMQQFIIEAVTLSLVGGITGMILGFILAWLVSIVIKLPASVSWWSVLLGFGFSAAVGIFFGWYPAQRAAELDPIEALRYE